MWPVVTSGPGAERLRRQILRTIDSVLRMYANHHSGTQNAGASELEEEAIIP